MKYLFWLFLLMGLWTYVPSFGASDPHLSIQVQDGRTTLTTHDEALSVEQLQVLESYLKRKTTVLNSKEGSLSILVRGEPLDQLRALLNERDLDDPEFDQEFEEMIKSYIKKSAFSLGESDSKRVFVGKSIHLKVDEISEELVLIGGSGRIDGEVDRLVVIGSNIKLGSTSIVQKELISIGSLVEKEDGAQVRGQEVTILMPIDSRLWNDFRHSIKFGSQIGWSLFSFLSILFLGFLYTKLAPEFHRDALLYLDERRFRSFLWGVVGVAAIVPLAIFICLSLVGILLIPAYLVTVVTALTVGYICGAIYLMLKIPIIQRTPQWTILILGVLTLTVIKPLPWGSVAVAIVAIAGFGAILRTLLKRLLTR